MSKEKIKIGIIGLGNCAKSLIEGIHYYSKTGANISGLMTESIAGYKPEDLEVVVAFDIDKRKIGKQINRAIYELPNNAITLHNISKLDEEYENCQVFKAPVLDGYAKHLDHYPESDRFLVEEELRNSTDLCRTDLFHIDSKKWIEDITKVLKGKEVDILINYLPVGSQLATEFWARICIDNKIPLVNCIPVFIASNPEWEKRFIEAGIPLIGDDMKSEFGASILSQMIQELAFARGHKVKAHIQRNVGGNTDFLNMEDKSRLASKKISKENVIKSQNTIRGISTEGSFLHAGPSEYIKYYGDNKVANFRIELEGFMGSPVILDAQLSVQDSPNSAGVVIDAVRYLRAAQLKGVVGALRGPSAFTQKTPPLQMTMEEAQEACREFNF